MLRSHQLIAMAFAAVPAIAIASGGEGPAFTMYAKTVEFRLDLVGHDRAGAVQRVAPTSLAALLPPSALPFVAGADHFRRTSDVGVLRRHLPDLARLACHHDETLVDVEVVLVERSDSRSDKTTTRQTEARIRCGSGT